MRIPVLLALLAIGLSGCESGTGERSAAERRIESCVDRLLQGATPQTANEEGARRYVRTTYCERFEANGWVYEDGALSIAAQTWLDGSGTCAVGTEGEPTRTVPCEQETLAAGGRLDCALLHHVRRSQVRAYVEQRERKGAVACDDGTPLDELGVP